MYKKNVGTLVNTLQSNNTKVLSLITILIMKERSSNLLGVLGRMGIRKRREEGRASELGSMEGTDGEREGGTSEGRGGVEGRGGGKDGDRDGGGNRDVDSGGRDSRRHFGGC